VRKEKARLKRASSIMMSILILASMLAVSFTTRNVEATGTVYIRTDGSIDAQTTPIRFADSNDREFDVDSSAEKHWSLDSAKEWGDLAYVDEDSAELVIGLNNAGLDASAEFSRIIAMNSGRIVDTVSNEESIWAIVADIPFDLVPSFECEVKSNSLVKYVEPNFRFQTFFVPDDPSWSLQWGSQMINADWAWNTTVGNSSVLVAIIDSGIGYDHPDLAANYVALGYDWVNNDTDPMDDNGHGTHCAGIIAAAINNSVGIAGLAQVRVMAEKALDSGGHGWSWDIAKAIRHAVDQGANILSNSWGSSENSKLIHDAVEYAYDNGVLIVAAAGNDPTSRKNYPAAYDEVIAVTAIDQNLDPASFTSFGDWVELAAPGVDIYSTVPWGYESWSGTSMACPHVSGVAALIWSCFPSMTRDQVRAQLRYSSQDLGAVGFDNYYGYGLPLADWAVETPPPEHDLLVLDFERKYCIKLDNQAIFNSSVLNFGASDESNVEVQLLVNGSMVDSVNIASLSSGSTTTVGLSWTPTVEGSFNVSCYVVSVAGETWTYYNVVSEVVSVKERIFVPDDYPTIQEAVDAASSGFEILVRGGTYYENVVVDKALLVSGESSATTTIDAGGPSYVVRVESSNVTVANFTLRNANNDYGILLYYSSSSRIIGNNIANNYAGIYFHSSFNNSVSGNNVSNNDYGIVLSYSSDSNSISRNNITANNGDGIFLRDSSNNSVNGNNVSNNDYGIVLYSSFNNSVSGNNIIANKNDGVWLGYSSNNRFCHNNFVSNTLQACSSPVNLWNDTYPSGGNYWSDYAGIDIYGSPYQNETGSDGIGDAPYVIDADNQDNYPLMTPFPIEITSLSTSKTVVGQGYSMNVSVTVENRGDFTETCNVTVCADAMGIRINDGLVGYWSFNEGNGTTANDSSGNHNDGAIYGANWTDGKFGKALSFDGIDDYVAVPSSPSLNNISDAVTIAAWVKLEQVQAGGWELIEAGGYSYIAYAYVSDPAGVRFNLGICTAPGVGDNLGQEFWNQYGATLPYLPYDQWYYVVWMYDSSGYAAIYVNENMYANTTLMSGKICNFGWGLTVNDDSKLHKGILDELRIYNRTLNQQEIKAVADSNATYEFIQTQTVNLTREDSVTLTFTWNTTGFAYGNYTLSAYAWPVPGETDLLDNNFTGGIVLVTIPGDFDGDVWVRPMDLNALLIAYGSPTNPQAPYNPNADIDDDGKIGPNDLNILLNHYGQHYP